MTNDNAKQETSDGEYNGLYYIEVTGNENIVINYTYTYKGENESGELKAAVTEIDNSPAHKISEVRRINPLRHSLDLISSSRKRNGKIKAVIFLKYINLIIKLQFHIRKMHRL